MKHTPGPWHTGGKLDTFVYAPDGYAVAGCQTYHGLRDEASTTANARLISAAPDLLAELTHITNAYSRAMKDAGVTHYPEALVEVRKARAAIAKATGGE